MAFSRFKLLIVVFLITSTLSPSRGAVSPEEQHSDSESKPCTGYSWKTIAIGGATGVAVGVGVVVAAPAVLTYIGFSTGGVVAGSVAATAQSAFYGNVAAGSLFATLQSVGAAGGLSVSAAGATTVTAAAAGAATGAALSDSGHESET